MAHTHADVMTVGSERLEVAQVFTHKMYSLAQDAQALVTIKVLPGYMSTNVVPS